MINYFRLLPALLFTGLLISSCATDADERGAEEAASALINANKNVVTFGHTNIDAILNKMDYKSIPMINAIVGAEYDSWAKGLDLKKPMYFALEAPFDVHGTPNAVFGLFDVKDPAALKEKLSSAGYNLEKNGNIDWYQLENLSFGLRNKLAIIVAKRDTYDGRAEIQALFKATEADLSDGRAKEILNKQGDIVLGVNIERLFFSANSALNKLPDAPRKELEAMATNSFLSTVVDFGKGNLTATTEHMFSDPMFDAMPFTDRSSDVKSKLGGGEAWMGFSANLDMTKFDRFVNNYTPNLKQAIVKKHPDMKMIMALLGESAFEKMFNGQFGFVAVGAVAEGYTPQFNAYAGLGSQGNVVKGLVETAMTMQAVPKAGNAYNLFGEEMTVTNKEIRIVNSNYKSGKLDIPAFAKGFGSKTFSFFMNLEDMNLDSFDLKPEQQGLKLIKHLYIESDRDGTELVVVAKDGSTNILKQFAQFYVNMAQGKLANM